MRTGHGKLSHGFTLLESLLAAVVLAMAVAAITMPFAAGAQNARTDATRSLAVCLAEEMMEEILLKPFYDPAGVSTPGPEAGETRATFNCIDDYDGYYEGPGNIASFDGVKLNTPESQGMSRQVTASYVYVSGQSTALPASFICVKVDVTLNGALVASVSRLVYGNR
jgi:MSHA pilin protein MshD